MNTETMVLLGVMTFLGLSFGWFLKNMNPFMILIGFLIFGSVLDFLIAVDHWLFTAPFMFGFFLQVAKPLYIKMSS